MFDTSLIFSLNLYPSVNSLGEFIFGFPTFNWPYGYMGMWLCIQSSHLALCQVSVSSGLSKNAMHSFTEPKPDTKHKALSKHNSLVGFLEISGAVH